MVETTVDDYVQKILKTKTSADLLKILATFRKSRDWSDVERQKVSHSYMRVLDSIMKSSPDEVKATQAPAPSGPVNDGPVWYEKM